MSERDNEKAVQIILYHLDGEKLDNLGVFHNVAANIAKRSVEQSLTYLLGVQDALGAIGEPKSMKLAEIVRQCRAELKPLRPGDKSL